MSSFSRILSRAELGLEAPEVVVETHLSGGLPGFHIVGLAETAVKESRDRVRSALLNSGFSFPQRRITVNLAPADLPKQGGCFDLAIATGILVASGQVPGTQLEHLELVGELALCGGLRPVRAPLPAVLACQRAGRKLVLPQGNAAEAALVPGVALVADCLRSLCAALAGQLTLAAPVASEPPQFPESPLCLSDIRGQSHAKQALEIAAAGGHSLLLCGPPGSGKSMLAQRLPGLLPPLTTAQAIEVAAVHGLRNPRPFAALHLPPFRAPHHSVSTVALAGGGAQPRPGEVSLSHHGVLFLDELPEFQRNTLETLREPLETGEIHLARAAYRTRLPAQFQLVAAMNPCPCGYLGDPQRACGDPCPRAARYQQKLSGPLLDRIDLMVGVSAVRPAELLSLPSGQSSTDIRERVMAARQRQWQRQPGLNRNLDHQALAPILHRHQDWLTPVGERLGLSARATHRLLRVARTVADLAAETEVSAQHLRTALAFRHWQG